ncbi:adenylate/guanylate cyclase domain-containing protein [Geminicoccus roseus]|uniref:adenylate/guanylate cyclase domain-containing protein n=1 Tax=Geminicoccus roseus TaxID=404900 RepID=UPI000429A1AB|nr:adenylate/guanylate cyclase domain-containing protein [Geminicoccus roseus]
MTIAHPFAFRFDGPRAKVWTALADTARFNEASGLPAHPVVDATAADGSRIFRAKARLGPLNLSWTDLPANWVKERWFEHDRLIDNGPLARFRVTLTLEEDGDGCWARYLYEAEPRGMAGRMLLATGFLERLGRHALKMCARVARFVRDEAADPFDLPSPTLEPRALDQIERRRLDLLAAGHPAEVVDALAALVREGGENDVRRIRPLALARKQGLEPRATVTACLDGARRGLLDLSWDLLCPRCRAAKLQATSLDQLAAEAHCDTCAIRYDRDFSRNVEVTFRPAAGLRTLVGGEFCLLGPMSTPHIMAHITLQPGQDRRIEVELPPGTYRARTLEPGPEILFDHEGGPLPAIELAEGAVALGPASPDGQLALSNRAARPLLAVIEQRDWVRDALTADRVAATQAFRDLFSDQVLRPGDEVGIARVAVLFSDLAGSTALYQKIGEAAAFRRVREHFAWLQQIVREHDGAIVKTIGDAIMAAFADPLNAVRAAVAIQASTLELNPDGVPPLALKIGVHAGPSIAVTLNERLDYFGSTANLAARLQSIAGPGEVVVSAALADDPTISELVAPITIEFATVRLRGFVEPVPCLRLMPVPLAGSG